jgi:HEAT repeat protein
MARLAVTVLFALPVCGCAGFWDEVTSKDFHVRALFTTPDPFVVLEQSREGDQRAKAYRMLGDADEYTGAQRARVLEILTNAASNEKQFLCRAAAIEALGHYPEPQAVAGLTQAFYSAAMFPGDMAARLQMQAVTALGKTSHAEAREFLILVAKDRPTIEGSEQERQLVLDVRLAATRALGNYDDPKAVEALQMVLRSEKDVAMRDCARVALKKAKGEDYWLDVDALAGMVGAGKSREEQEIELVGAPPPSSWTPRQ